MNENSNFEKVIQKRLFYLPSYSCYGGISGIYDFGPTESNIYEIEVPFIAPYSVLKASGHVDKFTDTLIFDVVTGDCFRADHYLKSELENRKIFGINLETMNPDQIDEIIKTYQIKSPNGNDLANSRKFNLMFKTEVGAKGHIAAFLRPETAQGQFMLFNELYENNGEQLPFGSLCIGKSFRNEISPKNGLIRTREFDQAEIEFYVDPKNKKHKKFSEIEMIRLNLVFQNREEIMSIKEAVMKNIIDNEIVGYFMGKAYIFCEKIGLNMNLIRFRQHEKDEMAHYASDCWDLEIKTSFGWIECAGIADRSCYDLTTHQKNSNRNFMARKELKSPEIRKIWTPIINKNELGKKYRQKFVELLEIINNLGQEFINLNVEKNENNEHHIKIKFEGDLVPITFQQEEKKVFVDQFVPHVIEPSFGISRIFYSLLEHTYFQRDSERNVFGFNIKIAPIQCCITNLRMDMGTDDLNFIFNNLKKLNIRVQKIIKNITMGKKYSVADEIGVPFYITIDTESVVDRCVTIRERDSMKQIRINIDEVCDVMRKLCSELITWEECLKSNFLVLN